MGLRNRTGADGTDRLRFIPNPVAAEAIAAEVSDDPDELDTWDATLGKWATAMKTVGGAYHPGPNAFPALITRLRANRQARRDKLDAITRKATEWSSVTGDIQPAPDANTAVFHLRQPSETMASRPAQLSRSRHLPRSFRCTLSGSWHFWRGCVPGEPMFSPWG